MMSVNTRFKKNKPTALTVKCPLMSVTGLITTFDGVFRHLLTHVLVYWDFLDLTLFFLEDNKLQSRCYYYITDYIA